MDYRKHLQAFIDKWRYNAARGRYVKTMVAIMFLTTFFFIASQAQMRIKVLEKVGALHGIATLD
jgi:ATP-binding cassette subfamily F protein 3